MKKILSTGLPAVLFAALLIPALSFTPLKNSVNAQNWDKLGQRKVNFRVDKDEISGRWDGWYKALQVKVRGGSINMEKMVVHFRNGQTEEIPLKNNFTDGSESRVIDLPGARRLIEKVVFWYEANATTAGNKPTVELWGRH
jgi:hypothetical protein